MLDKHQSSQPGPASAPIEPTERLRSRWWGALGTFEARTGARAGLTRDARREPRRPFSDAMAAAAVWVRRQRDKRLQPASEVVSGILDRLGPVPAADAPRRVVVVVAHPDDEAIGAGAVLRGFPDVTVVHVTDGAPLDEEYAQRRGYESRDAYARARRDEVVAALSVIGLPEARIRSLGLVDGEAAWHLVELCHKVADLFDELQPDVVLTHPYEGGHSDHDSTAFAVHLAAGMLLRQGQKAPIILELTSYHNYRGRRRFFSFLPFSSSRVRTVQLTADDRRVKREMFDRFTSQLPVLEKFPLEVERFRQAPRYLFTVPPHEGELDYERLCRRITGAEWRANAERALEEIRTRKLFRGSGSFEAQGGG
jgi:LmbE family N-acetylglucosaminyl deacetylase